MCSISSNCDGCITCLSLQPTAVRTGNLANFNQVLERYGSKFQAEGTYTLIIRLRHNVIKTGVRMINLSYSRISLTDISQKLLLDSPEDAEFIVAKVMITGMPLSRSSWNCRHFSACKQHAVSLGPQCPLPTVHSHRMSGLI